MTYLVVKKWGEKMNSPHPSRRNLHITIEPIEENVLKTLKNTANEIRMLVAQWDYYLGREWWVNYRGCSNCKTRQEYENLKFVAGEWVWQRHYCMRHYLVSHLVELLEHETVNIESNRYVEFGISKQQMALKLATNNYDYDITIHRTHAILVCNYKGNKYTFTYKNHTNALPYASTYFVLLKVTYCFANELQRYLAYLAHLDTSMSYNVYVNSVLYTKAGGD